MTEKERQKHERDLEAKAEWKELGFYYDRAENEDRQEWRFFGSKDGLKNIVSILDEYISNPINKGISEHEHYGPHIYLTIMTWSEPQITKDYIAGRLEDLAILKSIIAERLADAKIGDTFNIGSNYGIENTADARFFIKDDNFDPSTMDDWVWFDPCEKNQK